MPGLEAQYFRVGRDPCLSTDAYDGGRRRNLGGGGGGGAGRGGGGGGGIHTGALRHLSKPAR